LKGSMKTDTEILDWILHHFPELDHDWRTQKFWVRWYSESSWYVANGNNWRECVNNAINGNFEKS
jgi:hypothetical protein